MRFCRSWGSLSPSPVGFQPPRCRTCPNLTAPSAVLDASEIDGTVDGSEIRRSRVEVDRLSHYLQGFKNIRGGCLGFLNHQQYDLLQLPYIYPHPPTKHASHKYVRFSLGFLSLKIIFKILVVTVGRSKDDLVRNCNTSASPSTYGKPKKRHTGGRWGVHHTWANWWKYRDLWHHHLQGLMTDFLLLVVPLIFVGKPW